MGDLPTYLQSPLPRTQKYPAIINQSQSQEVANPNENRKDPEQKSLKPSRDLEDACRDNRQAPASKEEVCD